MAGMPRAGVWVRTQFVAHPSESFYALAARSGCGDGEKETLNLKPRIVFFFAQLPAVRQPIDLSSV